MGNILNNRFEQALLYAFRLHQSQKRKGSNTPYYAHLVGVCSIVLEHGGDEDQAIAALLHDAVEDQGGKATLDQIRSEFGNKVAKIVAECSDSDTIPKPPWLDRKVAYLKHLPRISKAARIVSLADKFYNATTIWWDLQKPDKHVWARFNAEPLDILWYYCMLVEKFQGMPQNDQTTYLTGELDRLVSRLVKEAGQGLTCIELKHRHENRMAPADKILYSIRKAVPEDIPALVTLDEIARIDEQRKIYIQKAVTAGECWLAEAGHTELAGYGSLDYSFYDQGFIRMLYIQKDRRRTGAGTALLKHLQSLCITPKIFTSTNQSNQAMQNLLALVDYQRSGIIKNLDDGDPELVFVKHLIRG